MEEKNKFLSPLGRTICFLFFFASFFVFTNAPAKAATLYFSPASGKFGIEDTFTVSVFVNTPNEAINNAEATVNFPANFLNAVSASQSNSIFSLWVQPVAISNSAGTITFNGGLPTPGYKGAAGKILSAVFKVKKSGSASLNFSSASVRANDGKGTDILSGAGTAKFTLGEVIPTEPTEPKPEPTVPPARPNTPTAPEIISPTHPDPTRWYSTNDATLAWPLPAGITMTRTLLGQTPTAVPTVTYTSPISSKEIGDIEDGQWYFHTQLRNSAGWGEISHFKLQIDTQPPQSFKVELKEGKETANPQPTLIFEAIDEMSGIDHYEIIIDQGSPIMTDKAEYKIPPQDLGKHLIIVKAADGAGNETMAMAEIEILAIEAPIITDYPRELLPGSIMSIKGTALPEATVKIYIQKDKEEAVKIREARSDKEGKWFFIEVEPVEKGVYQVWAETIVASGAKSELSKKIGVLVSPPVFIRIGKLAIDYLTTIMTLLILILVMILGVFWVWLLIREKRRKIRKEISQAEKALHEAFEALRTETEKQVAKLDDKPGLSARERRICNDLKKALKISEEYIGKEIRDIDKEME